MAKIAPSLLSADFTKLAEEVRKLEKAGADIIHLDVMDGHFVPNLTFGPPIIKQIRQLTSLPLDVHLMVNNPENYLVKLAEIGVEYVSFHQEVAPHMHRQLYVLKEAGVKAGIALNPATPVETIFPILEDLDFVLLMSVNPGFGGQSFLPLVYRKIEKLRKINTEIEIEVDGGVNNENAPKLIGKGCNILVSGSYILGNLDYKIQIESLRI
jgi:ribulose-phosphate 3-epimerase